MNHRDLFNVKNTRRKSMVCLTSFLCLPRWAHARWFSRADSDIPTVPPGRNFKWNFGPKGSRIEQIFIIKEYRVYDFSVGFGSPVAWDDKEHQEWRKDLQVREMVDTAEIQVNIQIQKIDETGNILPMINQVGSARSGVTGGDVVTRPFAHVKLRPGKYRVTATTLQETTIPDGIGTYLHIGFYPKASILKDND